MNNEENIGASRLNQRDRTPKHFRNKITGRWYTGHGDDEWMKEWNRERRPIIQFVLVFFYSTKKTIQVQ